MANMELNKLTKKELNKLWNRYMWMYNAGSSFERYHGMGYMYSLIPLFKKYYDKEGQIAGMQRHTDMFNTEMQVGAIVYGIVVGLEEQKALGANIDENFIKTTKLGLMGPVAGIGDALVQATLLPIMLSIAIAMSGDGNPLGAIAFMISFLAIIVFGSYYLFMKGYETGTSAVSLLAGEKANKINEAIVLLGVIIMGGIGASYIKFNTILSFPKGDQVVMIQDLLDGIFPGLLPLALVLGLWKLMSKRKLNIGSLTIILAVLCFVLAFFKVI